MLRVLPPALEDEPLIFVEVAFVNELPRAVGPILALESAVGDPRRARCAVFYSITSTQPGLRGISFGNFLIKQVAEDLHRSCPTSSSSHALAGPGPARLGAESPVAPEHGSGARDPARAPRRASKATACRPTRCASRSKASPPGTSRGEWTEARSSTRSRASTSATARASSASTGTPDASAKGRAQSFGVMVNYVYDLDDVEKNHEEYFTRHNAVASSAVESLAKLIEPLLLDGPAVL
jgi:malonyl-CoA decarboxylase